MKKTAYAILAGALAICSSALFADTGVTVHLKNGSTSFFPASDVDYVEFTGESESQETVVPDEYTYPLSYVVLPEGTPQQVKEYTGFTVNYNKNNHTPNYVAWELTAQEANGNVARTSTYYVDNTVEGCLSTDYAFSTYGYERGHMCPAADQKWSSQAMHDCMYMTNMVPQSPDLNGKIWLTLENKERDYAQKYGAVWIVAGPIYDKDDTLYIGEAKARVPHACFKALLYNDSSNPQAIAFVYANQLNSGNFMDYAMTIDELEELLGYDLFPALPDEVEKKVEASYTKSFWQ